MIRFQLSALAAGFLSLTFVAALPSIALAEENVVDVSGSVTITVPPDAAWITLYVIGDGLLASDAVRKANERADSAIKAVTDAAAAGETLEVENEDLGITQKQSLASFGQGGGDQARPQSARRLRIKLPPASPRVMTALDAALRAEAQLSPPSLGYSVGQEQAVVHYGATDTPELRERLRTEAMKDARAKAEALATLAGRKVGEVIRIGDCGENIPDVSQFMPFGSKGSPLPTPFAGTDPAGVVIRSSLKVAFRLE